MGPIFVKIENCFVGEDWHIEFSPIDAVLDKDVSTWGLTFTIGKADGGSDIANLTEANGGIILTDAVHGKGYVFVPRVTTLTIAPADYFYELRRTDQDDNKVITKGKFIVRP